MESHPTDRILGASAVVDALRAQIRRLAAFDGAGNPHVPTVLIQGETGTGKGLVARVMHDGGPRARRAFVDVNCAAIPETMLEAELFGFEAGAFTDARRPKPGLFEAASGGTLFLDEIDALSIPLQSKLLKAIEEKSIRRLGAVDARQVDVKLIAATQADLRGRVAAGTFRADLYHRLAVVLLEVPPLRARGEDAVGIAERLLATYANAHGVPPKTLTTDGRRWLERQPWPGNVRELGHLLERVTLLETAPEVDAAMLERLCVPVARSSPAATAPAEVPTSPDEEARIRSALARAGGNVVAAARLLGLGRNALRYRMRRYGIDRPTLSADAIDEPLPPPVATPGEPVWETKAVSVLAVELTFAGAGDADSPWTAMRRWTSEIETSIRGFGGAVYVRAPTRLGAVFGVPLAVEQGPQRAVQAAAAIHRLAQDAGTAAPEVRTAVHLGSVHWDTSAAEPLQLLPVGSTLSAADLLLGHAAAGDILVTSQVARRLAGRSELRPLDVRLRFGAQEMQALRVVRQASPEAGGGGAEPASEAASEAPYVGRERELAQLEDAFARAARGEGQVVFAVGEAGIGKSRLLAELRRRLAGTPHQWVQGHCTSYGSASAFLPIVDGLRRSFGIDDRDDEATATAKVDASITAAGAEVAWTRPLVRRLLSLPSGDAGVDALDAASRRSETFRALRALALHAASDLPIVVVVEDLHWIDPASEEYLAFLAEAVPTTRVLLVCSHRPGYRHPFGDRSYHLRVSIQPLSADEMSSMAGWLLGAAQLPEALHQLITSKAEGNPFFVEEVTRSLVEQGVLRRDGDAVRLGSDFGAVAVPDTIHEVLSARIDRLPAEARQAIQVAAVIGREFALRLLERIAEAPDAMRERVDELRALELVYQKALAPELAYMFKHALTHDVAYASVQPARRRALHRIIGVSIEELYADRLPEHWETLAHHFSAAEDWTRALRYSELAAEKAEASHANRAVVEHCKHALAIAERTDAGASAERIVALADRLGKACFYLSEYADSAVAHELAAARASDPETRALQLGNASMSHFWAHAYADAARTGGETLRLGRASGSASAEAVGLVLGGMASGIHDADVAAMERASDEALAVLARAPNEPVEGTAKHALMMAAEWTGRYERAIGLAERVSEIGTRHHLLHMVVWPLWFEGKARCCLGQYGVALEKLQAAYDFCDRIGDRAWKSRMLNTIGWCLAEVGSHERARAMNLRAAALAHEIGDPEIIANSEINLALNALALGDPARADAYLAPIEATLARPGDPWMRWRYGLHVQDARARLLLAGGEPERALALAETEHADAHTHRVPKAAARALVVRGRALLATDRREEARSALETATALADRIGYPRAVVDAQQVLAALARRTGDAEAAARAAARAADVGARLGATLVDDDLRRTWNASLGR